MLNISSGFIPSVQKWYKSGIGLILININPLRYTMEAFYIIESKQLLNKNNKFKDWKLIIKDNNKDYEGWILTYNQLYIDIIVTLLFGIIFRVCTYIALKYNNKEKQL